MGGRGAKIGDLDRKEVWLRDINTHTDKHAVCAHIEELMGSHLSAWG